MRSILTAEGVPYCFIGAFAAVAWGRPRATTDVDLVIIARQPVFSRLDQRLRAAGLDRGADVGPSDPADALPDIAVYWSSGDRSVRVDLFIAKTQFEIAVIDTARSAAVLGREARLASPEASIIYKLIADRPRDREDIAGILRARAEAGDVLDWEWMERWAGEWEVGAALAELRAGDRSA